MEHFLRSILVVIVFTPCISSDVHIPTPHPVRWRDFIRLLPEKAIQHNLLQTTTSPTPQQTTTPVAMTTEELKEPCKTTYEVPDIGTRLPDITTDHGSDSHLTKRWYTAGRFLDMADSFPPGQRGCGAEEQCWMKGDMPNEDQGEVSVEICVASVHVPDNNCYKSFFIKVKNCGEYRVYKLETTALNADGAARYCFEPQGVSDAKAPTFRPTNVQILTQMMLYEDTKYEIKFSCDFEEGPDLFYSVLFYVNDKLILIKPIQSKEEAFILESELTEIDKDYIMGITITCSVGAKVTATGPMGPRTSSADFYAGLKIESSPVVQVARGGNHTIRLRPTVPVGCSFAACKINVYLVNSVKDDHHDCHTNGIDNYQKCSIGIQGGNNADFFDNKHWDKEYEYTILTSESQLVQYELQRTQFKLQFRMFPKRHHQFWDGLSQSVMVNVYENDDNGKLWKNKACRIFCDPHMQTFDGMQYELQKGGEYLAFKHETLPMQVQIKTDSCSHKRRPPYCVCGISVVVGRAVFLLNTCDRSAREARFLSCGGKDELRVVEKDNTFKFYLPTGAVVEATRAYRNFWNIVITPTVHEIKKTSALCGSLDGDRCNDCVHRNGLTKCSHLPPRDGCRGGNSFHPDEYTKSYKLRKDENLFLDDYSDAIQGLIEYPDSEQLCYCPYDAEGKRAAVDDTRAYAQGVCGYRKFSSCQLTSHDVDCKVQTMFQKKIRKKRTPLQELSNHINQQPDQLFHVIRKRESLTETEARQICTTTMNGSPTLNDCDTMGLSTSGAEIEYCVLDLLATGNMVWAADAMNRAGQSCLHEVSKNRTVRTIHPESAALVQNFTCQNNCSNQGVCSNGECTCDEGYAAADCSVDLSTPPSVNSLDLGDDLICDRHYGCDEVFVNGGDFPFDRNYTCGFMMSYVDDNGSKTFLDITNVTGRQRNIFQVTCPLEFTNSDVISFVSVKVKMDDNDFSSGLEFVIVNSTCQGFTFANGVYEPFIKAGFCYIDDECLVEGYTNSSNCRRCQTNTSQYSWTPITDIPGCMEDMEDEGRMEDEGSTEDEVKSESDNVLIIGIAVGCSILFLVLVITVVVVVKKNMTSRRHASANLETRAKEDPLLAPSSPHQKDEDIHLQAFTSLN